MEPVQDPQQFMMPELEGCSGKEQHPLEHVAERTLEGCRVLFGLFVREQSSELVLVLDVMCFVEDEKWQVLVERSKALRPRLVEGQIELTSRRPKTRLETAASAHWDGGKRVSKRRQINPRDRLLQRERNRVVAEWRVRLVALPHSSPLRDRRGEQRLSCGLVEPAVGEQGVREPGHGMPPVREVAAPQHRPSKKREPYERVVKVAGERTVGDDNKVASLGRWIIEQFEEVASTPDGAGRAQPVTWAQTALREDRPLHRPLVSDA